MDTHATDLVLFMKCSVVLLNFEKKTHTISGLPLDNSYNVRFIRKVLYLLLVVRLRGVLHDSLEVSFQTLKLQNLNYI